MFQIGDRVIVKPTAGMVGAVGKADKMNQPFLYIVSMTKHQTYIQCGISHLPYSWGSEVSYVGMKELLHYDESEMVEQVIKRQHRVGVLKLKIDRALDEKDEASFVEAVKELKEVTNEQGEID